jgi:hypothetical protein
MSFNDEVMSEASRRAKVEAAQRDEWVKNHELRAELENKLTEWFERVGITSYPDVQYDLGSVDTNTSDYSGPNYQLRAYAEWQFEDHKYTAEYNGYGEPYIQIYYPYKNIEINRPANTRKQIGEALLEESKSKDS